MAGEPDNDVYLMQINTKFSVPRNLSLINLQKLTQQCWGYFMFMDVVVFAGIATVLLMICFFVGVGIFIMKDQERHAQKEKGENGQSHLGVS